MIEARNVKSQLGSGGKEKDGKQKNALREEVSRSVNGTWIGAQ
jgi:hypothetical protein